MVLVGGGVFTRFGSAAYSEKGEGEQRGESERGQEGPVSEGVSERGEE